MAQLKFFRGQRNGASLPTRDNGSIFVIKREDVVSSDQEGSIYGGDLYVDIEQGNRLQIMPEANIDYMSHEDWDNIPSSLTSIKGKIYVCQDYTDYEVKTNTKSGPQTIKLPGIKIGDGAAAVVDLPIFIPVIQEEKDFWNDKVSIDIRETNALKVKGEDTRTDLELFPNYENYTLVFSNNTNTPYIGPGTN